MTERSLGATPYEVLGVDAGASTEELRRAYRRRLRESHPDVGGDPELFHEVQTAWEQVGTPAHRARYDRVNRPGGAAAGGPGSNGSRPSGPASARTSGTGPQAAGWSQAGGASGTGGAARTGGTSRTAGSSGTGGVYGGGGPVWTAGSSRGSTNVPSRARTYGHPGGWSRERYLTLLREWVGRGVAIDDPYAPDLVARAPREIQHALADALAEERTARTLGDLSSAFTVWNDVATGAGSGGWARDADAPATDPAKIDHVVLGPTGLWAIQSEDWGAPVTARRGDLVSTGFPAGEHPMAALERRAKVAKSWRTRFDALLVVLPDDALAEDADWVLVRRRGTPRLAVRARGLARLITGGHPAVPRPSEEAMFALRPQLRSAIRFV
ncbi:DnaJ domain-containing protein [Occultella gossypii]|uniref:DnaJ domain-containing protein n=1 Tax=Occultella gossypii TaxID=2800820 RepID=A0ABS7SI63_9MICO|nr:DnaJ domain-containing protein [Occultella gossypii]MBZ2199465.1 DnaJ domain-containing protein [Occultella gossypii]